MLRSILWLHIKIAAVKQKKKDESGFSCATGR